MKTLPNISDAVITNWDGGAIEYHAEGDSTYTAENAFIFTPTTPRMGLLTLNDRNGREMLTMCQGHDLEDFDAYIAHRVACHVEMYW